MSVIVGLDQNQTINQSGADSVSFLGLGTLDITGTLAQPITVTLSQVAGIGVANTISLTDADVTLSGVGGRECACGLHAGAGKHAEAGEHGGRRCRVERDVHGAG